MSAPPRSAQAPGSSPTMIGVFAPSPKARFASELATRTRAPDGRCVTDTRCPESVHRNDSPSQSWRRK